MNFQDDIFSVPIDNFKDHKVLVFDLISMQYATEDVPCPELAGEPLKLGLTFNFPLEHLTVLIVLGEQTTSVAVYNMAVVGKYV